MPETAWTGPERRSGSRELLEERFRAAMIAAGEALGGMTGRKIRVEPPVLERHTANGILDLAGGPEAIVVAVYVGISGPLVGHALLILTPADAHRLAGLLLEGLAGHEEAVDPATGVYAPDPLVRSALEETGNVVIANFLTAFAPDHLSEPIHPSVPQSVVEMAGAILDGILIELSVYEDTFLVARTAFHTRGLRIDALLLVLPIPGSLPEFSRLHPL